VGSSGMRTGLNLKRKLLMKICGITNKKELINAMWSLILCEKRNSLTATEKNA
jgi:hypothetical protein